MSLVSNEGDSEQNEIRNLQEKLESTMSLVKQLSGQLAELKEQVSKLRGGAGVGVRAISLCEQGDPETPGNKSPRLCPAASQQAGTPPGPLQACLTLWTDREGALCSGDRPYLLPGFP